MLLTLAGAAPMPPSTPSMAAEPSTSTSGSQPQAARPSAPAADAPSAVASSSDRDAATPPAGVGDPSGGFAQMAAMMQARPVPLLFNSSLVAGSVQTRRPLLPSSSLLAVICCTSRRLLT